jgi:hypothetical protein
MMSQPGRILAVVLSLAVAGCMTSPAPVDALGLWGGSHVSMQITSTGGRVEYDCADGVIEGRIHQDGAGRFTATGAHTPGHGGPIREGEILPSFRARYDGQINGERMSLLVTLIDTGGVLGPFELRRGSHGLVVRCLSPNE